MTGWGPLFVLLLAAANPAIGARVNRTTPTIALAAAVAALVAIAGVVVVALIAEPALDTLEIEPETARIAAGLVLAISGGQAIVLGGPLLRDIPTLWQRGIYPLGIPVALNPALLACSVAFAVHPDAGEVRTLTLGAIAVALTAAVAFLVPERFSTLADGIARLTGALAILLGAAMVVSGVRDV